MNFFQSKCFLMEVFEKIDDAVEMFKKMIYHINSIFLLAHGRQNGA